MTNHHSLEAEQGILSCILQDPNECINHCVTKLTFGAREFYDLRHQTIYAALLAMWEERKPIDPITLHQYLRDTKRIQDCGGLEYVITLPEKAPSASNLPQYLSIVVEKSMLRELVTTCATTIAASETGKAAQDLIAEAERAVLCIRASRESGRGEQDLSAIQNELMADYEAASQNQKQSGVLSGFYDLDRVAGGMMPQELIIVAGSPSAGKTTTLCNILFHAAESGVSTAFISMETSSKKIVHRLHCMAGKVSGSPFMRGDANQGDFDAMSRGVIRVSRQKKNLIIRDDIYDATSLLATCRQLYQRGVRLFGIDYIQKISTGAGREYDQVTEASRVCKQIAKELNVPVIAISSLNRGDKDTSKKPTMSDLRGSGNLEFDADKIYLLHCEDRETSVRPVELNVAKNKDGACGKIELTLFASEFRVESQQKIGNGDLPEHYQ